MSANRREFLCGLARYAAGGALLGGAGVLVGRKGECVKRVACAGCGSYSGCSLPKAVEAREAEKVIRARDSVRPILEGRRGAEVADV